MDRTDNHHSSNRPMPRVIAATMAALLILVLAGCTKTITVTDKYRSWVGWYFLCDGGSWAPCVKGHIWRVSKQTYEHVKVGQHYTVNLP